MSKSEQPETGRARGVLIFVIVAVGFFLYYGFYKMVTPTMYRLTDPSAPINYVLVPDHSEYGHSGHFVRVDVWPTGENKGISVKILFKKQTDDKFYEASMERVDRSNVYAFILPPLENGQRWFYFIQAAAGKGHTVKIPPNAPDKPLPWVTYEGRVSPYILSVHIALVVGSIFFLIHALYFALLILSRARESDWPTLMKCYRSVLLGWLSFFIGAVPLGIYVSNVTFGPGNQWGAFPFGKDITDNKTQLEIIIWLIVLLTRIDLLKGKPGPARVTARAFTWLVVAGTIATAAVYMIPHSLFVQ
jgi:hypothetical protein